MKIRVCVLLLVFALGFAGCSPSPQNSSATPPEEAASSTSKPDTLTGELSPFDRVHYAYRYEELEWIEDPSVFPAQWLEAAFLVVASNEEIEEEITFQRGILYDFSGKGEQEALLSFHGFVDRIFVRDHCVYVNASGEATLIDRGARGPGAAILHYNGFRHLQIMSGADNAAGSHQAIFQIQDGHFEQLASTFWFMPTEGGVFLRSGGPQGIGPGYYFWDAELERYSAIGPAELSVETFTDQFSFESLCRTEQRYPDDPIETIRDQIEKANLNLNVEAFTTENVSRVVGYGNRFFSIYFTDESGEELCMTWERFPEGWSIVYPATKFFGMGSMEWSAISEEIMVSNVDMDFAESSAIQPD